VRDSALILRLAATLTWGMLKQLALDPPQLVERLLRNCEAVWSLATPHSPRHRPAQAVHAADRSVYRPQPNTAHHSIALLLSPR
jgi:hypothetical protein